MKRGAKAVIEWLLAVLLVPIAVLAAIIAGLFARPAARTPAEVIALMNGFLNGTDERAWDDFESVPIADPYLESVRRRAIPMGPPDADEAGLRKLVAEVVARFSQQRQLGQDDHA